MVTGSWKFTEFYSLRIDSSIVELKEGVLLTSYAFSQGIPFGSEMVTIAVVLLLFQLLLVGHFMEIEQLSIYLGLVILNIIDMFMY